MLHLNRLLFFFKCSNKRKITGKKMKVRKINPEEGWWKVTMRHS